MALKDWKPADWFRKSNENQNIDQADFDDDLNGSPEINKIVAELALEALKPSVGMVAEQIGALSRWLLATLVTINGGAILALLSIIEHMDDKHTLIAAILFIFGIVFAILAATVAVTATAVPLATLGQMIGYWSMVAQDGERLGEIEKKLKIGENRTKNQMRHNAIIGALSLAFFVAGVITIIVGFNPK